ncbi:TPA: glycosyltransferase [Enterococcus faecium]|uniref:glycosyltransferase n=1 Tax=Enterococcus TaxID=1350 RepID=UPI000BF8086E|nr:MULTISPECIES: glycosyltransferase [Enterococcus]EGP4821081.1 glycosyltransferase family 4 protein [Enterococcus faecium]EME3500765.1 glycosyltransferase [Enterococcus faecium]EME5452488.1 glycosyltransferase [Enterococcus faecium]MDW3718627.1 glycosyltransferase [Enterococcus faecium]PEQ19856.1 hypothetical protein CRN00_12305 [Enterococcus faecium]
MKILFLAAANSIHSIRWVNSLAELGHEVHFVYLPNQNPDIDGIDKSVIQYKLKYGGNKGYYLNAPLLKKIFINVKPDVVNAHYASGYGTLARVSRLRPLLLSVWGSDVYDFPEKNTITNRIVKSNIRYADRIASTSYAMANQVKKLMDNDNLKIDITPFGVDLSNFENITLKSNKPIIIGTIKTLAPKYGLSYLIKAIDFVRNKTEKHFKLEIYGKGPEKESLQKLISDLSLNDIIELKGYIPNSQVPQVLNTFDIFCVTSIMNSESFGVAAVEAMAAKLPVVATDVDGFKEVVQDRVTGIIVEKGNINMIANAILELIENSQLRCSYGQAGYKRVTDLYDWDKNVKKMEKIYLSMLDKGE